MPFPLSKVRTLRDYEGQFHLDVTCVGCGHGRVIAARTLANFAGPSAPIATVVKRLRCTRCQGRVHDIKVVGIPRQR